MEKQTAFEFRQDPISNKWVIIAPKRARRPGVNKDLPKNFCPFCSGAEHHNTEVFRIGGKGPNWLVRVVENRFPFAPIHEIVIHSQDHHKNFDELPLEQVERIFLAYQNRFQAHVKKGKVIIFNNHGRSGGESISHPHTQIAVVPFNVKLETPSGACFSEFAVETDYFKISAPEASEWPWEVWIEPKKSNGFGSLDLAQIADLAHVLRAVLKALTRRLGHDFPFNFYIYPEKDWYLRIMPRTKFIGGFELATGIFVNSQDPGGTIEYLKKNLEI